MTCRKARLYGVLQQSWWVVW